MYSINTDDVSDDDVDKETTDDDNDDVDDGGPDSDSIIDDDDDGGGGGNNDNDIESICKSFFIKIVQYTFRSLIHFSQVFARENNLISLLIFCTGIYNKITTNK